MKILVPVLVFLFVRGNNTCHVSWLERKLRNCICRRWNEIVILYGEWNERCFACSGCHWDTLYWSCACKPARTASWSYVM